MPFLLAHVLYVHRDTVHSYMGVMLVLKLYLTVTLGKIAVILFCVF